MWVVIFASFYCLLDLKSAECDVVSLYVLCCPVNGSVCFVCLTVFVNCLVNQFAICLGVFAILLLKLMELLCVVGGALLDRPSMVFHRMCVLCLWSQWASRCSFHMFCLCFCMSEVISSFRSLRTGSQAFAFLMLFVCVILHTMSSGKSMQLLCIFPLGMLSLSAISMMFVNIMLAVYMLVGMVVWAKANSVSSMNCVHSDFL